MVILLAILILWNIVSDTSLGGLDFTGYWSATYLLHNGQNPYSSEQMKEVQRTQVHSKSDATILTWNPPTLFVFLLPLAWMSFNTAKFVWLIVNIIIIFSAGLMLIGIYMPTVTPGIKLIFLLFVISFPSVTTAFYMGQVTFLVFWGLVACVTLIRKERWFWAGAALILTTVKPHIAILSALYILIYMAKYRKYWGWIGLAFAGSVCLLILFGFRSNLLWDFSGATTVADVKWATSTVGGLLSYFGITETARYVILLFLPLPFLLVKYSDKFSVELSIALLTLLTVPTTFFGWSYDQAVLLIPIAQVFSWMTHSKNKWFLWACILCAFIINYYQRSLVINETYYVWVPLFWWFIFGTLWREISFAEKKYASAKL